jgi:hypothetical protein
VTAFAVSYYEGETKLPRLLTPDFEVNVVSLVGFLAFFVALLTAVKEVSGAWLRPTKLEAFFLLEASRTASKKLLPVDAALEVAHKELQLENSALSPLMSFANRRILHPGSEWEVIDSFVVHRGVSLALQDPKSKLSSLPLEIERRAFKLDSEIVQYRESAMIHARAKGGLLYNESKIRLTTDLELKNEAIRIQKTSYFESICSNELVPFLISPKSAQPGTGETDMFQYLRHPRTGALVGLRNSKLSNHMGGGTIAITQDGYLIVSKQGRLTQVASGLHSPTGSGSFDWADRKDVRTFADVIRNGLVRELREEGGFREQDVGATWLIGYGRDLQRGGKPEFFGVTLVNAEPKIGNPEIGFIDHHIKHPLRTTTREELKTSLELISRDVGPRASTALVVNLRLLADASDPVHDAIVNWTNAASGSSQRS